MAFVYTVNNKTRAGNKFVVSGTFTNAAVDTGGVIDTGLGSVDFFSVQQTGPAVITNAPVVNETFPMSSKGRVTIVTDANADGIWLAVGI